MKEITATQLKDLQDSQSDFQLIDVREPNEHQFANIEGSELIPLGDVIREKDKIRKDAEKVVVFCRSGKRSANAITMLENNFGYENLYNLKGGILAYSDDIDPSIPKY